MRKVFLAADHTGVALKKVLIPLVAELGFETVDCGAYDVTAEDDYPDVITPCARRVAAEPGAVGIVIGGSGQGEAMAANRVPGIRAAVYYGEAIRPQTDSTGTTLDIISSSRVHNDANVLSLGARFITHEQAQEAVRQFLETAFSGDERHRRRVRKLA